jgi:formylglycine-generating enzyme required for sulfatase activity
MVRVQPGVFVMGSEAEEAFDREKPEHLVQITQDYYIGVHLVTQEVWKAVMDGHNPSRFVGDKRPVEQVSWQDIVEGGQDDKVPEGFLPRLNTQYPLEDGALSGFAFRLPTEAEWEYAAKGGHKTALSSEQVQSFLTTSQPKAAELYTAYSGSDQLKEVGWYGQNSHKETKAFGKCQPNELGLYDMSGNVHEWGQDWFDRDFYVKCKEQSLVQDLLNVEDTEYRVARGGSWNNSTQDCRVSYRSTGTSTTRRNRVGFRLVLAPVQRSRSTERSGRGG